MSLEVPAARVRLLQHALDTYASETMKIDAVWARFSDSELGWRPDERSQTVGAILKHELLSLRRFYGGFLGVPELAAEQVLPAQLSIAAYSERLLEMAAPRLAYLAVQEEAWWTAEVEFFDVRRERVWVFWRRILHSAHHRTQLCVYLRLLGKPVPAIYGPTADESWSGADPTHSVEASKRTHSSSK